MSGVPAGYPGYPPGYAPPLSPSSNGTTFTVVAIVAAILVAVMAVAFIVLPFLLYIMVSGLTTGPPTADAFGLAAGPWSGGAIGIEVLDVPDGLPPVADLAFRVYDHNGTLFFNGAAGTTQAVNGTSVTVNHVDTNGNGLLEPGESIQVTVGPAEDSGSFAGGTLSVYGPDGAFLGLVGI